MAAATCTGASWPFTGFLCCVILATLASRGDGETQAPLIPKKALFIVTTAPYPVSERTQSPRDTWEDGPDIAPAVRLAMEQINERTDILRDYTLHLVETEEGCDNIASTYVSIVSSIYYFRENEVPVGIIGPRCSDSALAVASLLDSNPVLPFISLHLGMVPSQTSYPYMLGILGSVSTYAEALAALLTYNDWRRISILYSATSTDYYTAYQYFSKIISEDSSYDVELSAPISETYLPLQSVRDSYTRVIIAFVNTELLPRLLCLAHHEEVTFPTYQWVIVLTLPDDLTDAQFRYNGKGYYCSKHQLYESLEGAIALFADIQAANDTQMVSGYTYSEYIQQYEESLHQSSGTTLWANPMYDATWALALALNSTDDQLRQSNLSLSDYSSYRLSISDMITENIYNYNGFVGASGNVTFQRSTGFALRRIGVYQYYASGHHQFVGYYDGKELVITETPEFISDELEPVATRVPLVSIACVLVVTLIPLLLTAFAQTTSIIYRRYQPIRGSSYKLNQFAYVGAYILVAGVFLFTTNETLSVKDDIHSVLCVATTWTFSIGTTLILATMCMKVWRLYRIFTASSHLRSVKNPKLITDGVLSLGVISLVLVAVVICVLWAALDWPVWEVTRADIEGTNPPTNYTVSQCNSDYTVVWVSLLVGYASLITLSSCVLAFLSRRIEQKGIQVKNVLVLVYILFLIQVVGSPISVVLEVTNPDYKQVARYCLLSVIADAILYSYVIVLFLPPIIVLMKQKWSGTLHTAPERQARTYSFGPTRHRRPTSTYDHQSFKESEV